MKHILLALLSSLTLIPVTETVSVDVSRVLSDVSSKPIGINTDYFVDDDRNRPAARRLDQALAEMGVKYLRYPGGEKSDGNLWSVPPYDRPQPTLARWATGEWPQNQEWPSYDRTLVKSDGHTLAKDPLDFDEFMQVVHTVNGEPVIVVAYDSMSKPAQANGTAPSRAELLEAARQWVRYANVVKGYNVKYWEIGNESYLPGYNSDFISPDAYAQDVIAFSQAMKSIDPSIKILANGDGYGWWNAVLTRAGSAIDLLAVHNYPPYGWGSYDYYRSNDVDLLSAVHVAERSIDAYATPDDAARIKVAVTEMNTIDWTQAWQPDNDLGHAVVLFDAVGQQLIDPRIAFSQVWNTRWVTADAQTSPAVWDALDPGNTLQATGQAMAIWGQFLLDRMVATTSTPMVKTFASASASGRVNLFLVNKDTTTRQTRVSLAGLVAQSAVSRWVFRGAGPDDDAPVLAQAAPVTSDGTGVTVALDPVSVTVLTFDARVGGGAYAGIPSPVPGIINAKDFDNGGEGISYHDTTSGNSGGAYRSTDVDLQSSPGAGNDTVGWVAPGEWLAYSIDVRQGGTFTVTAKVASIYSGRSFHLEVGGTNVTGPIAVPNTQGWDRWTSVSVDGVALNAGIQMLKFVADSNEFNVSTFDIEPAAATVAGARLMLDDFEAQAGSSWVPAAGTWAVCKPVSTASWEYCGLGQSENIALAGSPQWRDYSVQSYVYLNNDSGSGVTVLGRVQDASHFYQAELRQDGAGNKTWTLWKNSGGSWSWINSGYFEYSARSYYLLRLSMIGSSIQVSVSTDWGTTFQPLGGGNDTEFTSGKIGLRSWGSAASFDSVEVSSR